MKRKKLPHRHEVIELLESRGPKPMHAWALAEELGVRQGDFVDFLRLLDELALDGVIRRLSGQRFRSAEKKERELREGRLRVNPRGFGFVCSAGNPEDVYVQEAGLAGAMHGDMVRVEVMARSSRGLEGRVIEVTSRANARVQGILRKTSHGAWLELDDARLRGPVPLSGKVDGNDGDAAVAMIVEFPESVGQVPKAELLQALGPPGSLEVETRKVLLRHGIEEGFADDVLKEAEHFENTVDASLFAGREDLRDLDFLTIDPDDARDRDDAIWVCELDDGWQAWVAIADVASYVQPGTQLDKEAMERGFSVYLPDRAVPMLPPRLSSELCSLHKDEDRLCIAVWMRFDEKGHRTDFRVHKAVIRSRATLDYGQVASGMKWSAERKGEPLEEWEMTRLDAADRLSKKLRRRRMRRGALELITSEPRILLDPDSGMPFDIIRQAEDPGVKRAYRVIEELMIVSNETIADWLGQTEDPVVYRIHPPPSEDKLQRLAQLCDSLEIPFEYDDAADPKRLGHFLRSVQDHPLASIIGVLTLRSLSPASYGTENIGHCGLASKAYAHFTSPIRRYPDLVIHRLVHERLDGVKGQVDGSHDIAMHCTRREREVVEVEREVVDVYRCILMREHIGMRSMGIVTDIGPSSVTVTLDSPFLDVMVPDGLLGRGYERSEDGLHLLGHGSGDRISLGDKMEIEVESADLTRRVITAKRIPTKKIKRKIGKRRGRTG
jgi:ribonuclease R